MHDVPKQPLPRRAKNDRACQGLSSLVLRWWVGDHKEFIARDDPSRQIACWSERRLLWNTMNRDWVATIGPVLKKRLSADRKGHLSIEHLPQANARQPTWAGAAADCVRLHKQQRRKRSANALIGNSCAAGDWPISAWQQDAYSSALGIAMVDSFCRNGNCWSCWLRLGGHGWLDN